MKIFHKIVLTAAAVFVLGSGSSVYAIGLIKFDQTIDGGTISYDGTPTGVLTGTNILFDSVSIENLPNAGIYDCVNCQLNFETGSFNQTFGGVDFFNGGGFYHLTGTIQETGGGSVIASGLLVDGIFTGFVTRNGTTFAGNGTDTKHQDLVDFVGVDPNLFSFAQTEISADLQFNGTGFSGTVNEADLTNTPIPEPGTVLLLGTGLAAIGIWRYRSGKV